MLGKEEAGESGREQERHDWWPSRWCAGGGGGAAAAALWLAPARATQQWRREGESYGCVYMYIYAVGVCMRERERRREIGERERDEGRNLEEYSSEGDLAKSSVWVNR